MAEFTAFGQSLSHLGVIQMIYSFLNRQADNQSRQHKCTFTSIEAQAPDAQ